MHTANSLQGHSSQKYSRFVVSRCTTCEAGWTRKDDEGKMVIACLLDREPVWPVMVSCDRYAPRVKRQGEGEHP
jgi:hypothetical protein